MSSKPIRAPGIPAPPKNGAHSDHSHAELTPTEISVSIVAARWWALVKPRGGTATRPRPRQGFSVA